MKNKLIGNLMIVLGLALIFGAVGLTYHNLNVEQTGGETANAVITAIHEQMPEAPTLGAEPVIYYPAAYVLTDYGVEIPDYVLNPKMKMPKKNIDGIDYIGCGACENLCPSRPFSAFYVEGHEVHREI